MIITKEFTVLMEDRPGSLGKVFPHWDFRGVSKIPILPQRHQMAV